MKNQNRVVLLLQSLIHVLYKITLKADLLAVETIKIAFLVGLTAYISVCKATLFKQLVRTSFLVKIIV